MKDPYKLDTVIAEQEILFEIGNKKCKILIQIGKPQIHPEPDIGWYCPLRITGFGSEKIHAAFGLDSIGAIQSALEMTGQLLVLYLQKSYPEQNLVWLEPEHFYFPKRITPEESLKKETARIETLEKHDIQIQWKRKTVDFEN
ncbi:DUF6968 family protein [Leptospira alstonii]|uniref:DUF6968 family protein n=1 Tax=Leptospira alstonii TaxID=28452 RepID=UPI000773D3DE|nr:hypothetical protein [Leptospira alstonii]